VRVQGKESGGKDKKERSRHARANSLTRAENERERGRENKGHHEQQKPLHDQICGKNMEKHLLAARSSRANQSN